MKGQMVSILTAGTKPSHQQLLVHPVVWMQTLCRSGSTSCISEIHTLNRHWNLPTLIILPLHEKEKIMSSSFNWQRLQNYFISLEHMKSCLYSSIQIPPPTPQKGTHSFWNVKDLATQLQEGLFPDLGLDSLYSVSDSLAPRSQYFQYMFSQLDFTTKKLL